MEPFAPEEPEVTEEISEQVSRPSDLNRQWSGTGADLNMHDEGAKMKKNEEKERKDEEKQRRALGIAEREGFLDKEQMDASLRKAQGLASEELARKLDRELNAPTPAIVGYGYGGRDESLPLSRIQETLSGERQTFVPERPLSYEEAREMLVVSAGRVGYYDKELGRWRPCVRNFF